MPTYDLIRRGGRVLDPANTRDGYYDIGIVHGRIEAVEPELDPALAAAVPDMSEQWVMPGHIDTHVLVAALTQTLAEGLHQGKVLGEGGTLLVTQAGETAARASGLAYRVVELNTFSHC
ncbi:hypothetical protein [Candidatus Entotheonella palauensis]|uniref:hypothetical protein n=1 Tax=Candidatus Entotheonella palauensis TaxID=93172 RepID=UPI000B7E48C7|nr:hypothetical protein [Candidatus Entotheonella palauensis]